LRRKLGLAPSSFAGRNINKAATPSTTANIIFRMGTLTHWATYPPAKEDNKEGTAIAKSNFQSTVLLRPKTRVAEMLAVIIINRLVVLASRMAMPAMSRTGT
jgi:hypothetical protein